MQSLDDDKLYALAKLFNPEEPYKNNQDTTDEHAWLDKECSPTINKEPPPESSNDSDELSDFKFEAERDNSTGTDGSSNNQNNGSVAAADHATKMCTVLNAIEKIHAIVVHATSSPRHHKHMRGLIRQLCIKILTLIRSMPVCWNSVLAKICGAFILRKAINQWVLTLDEGLTSCKQTTAHARKLQWMFCDSEWDLIGLLIKLLEPFEQVTLYFSKKSVDASLPAVLPTYARLLDSLNMVLKRIELKDPKNQFGIKPAIVAGRDELIKYIKISQKSQLTFLAMTLHPQLCLTTFNDPIWDRVTKRGCILLEHLYEVYCANLAEDCPPATLSQIMPSALQSSSHGSWNDFLYQQTQQHHIAFTEEINDFFSNKYPFDPKGNLLDWWKVS
ncbi:hypothetical protein FS749_011590 [Ceratobasidium sp. UAMH 11750]|nr:hypothetical protein FS749_011590 [Ceratobasidium sp. UAMH 11750]